MNRTDEKTHSSEAPSRELVTFRVQAQSYAVPIEAVSEMTLLRDLEPIVGAPRWIRGMMQLRDRVVPILDLRLRLGLTSLSEEVEELESDLKLRKAEHISWLQTLESCSATGERFDLQRDPTQCAFGLWFYSFKTEDAILSNQISKFEEPHNRIHALADHCLGLAGRGLQSEAQKAIDQSRETDLNEMIQLFDTTVRSIRERNRQIVVILRGQNENLGLTVDRVESVTAIDAGQINARPLHELETDEANEELLVESVVRANNGNGLIQILDIEKVFAAAGVRSVDDETSVPAKRVANSEPRSEEIQLG